MTQQKERRLGRGLDALIGAGRVETEVAATPDQKKVEKLALDSIVPNPWQPRKEFGEADLEDLIRSIQRHGVIQPILVRRAGDRFQIVAGERRWRASQELGTGTIDAIVIGATDREMLEWSIIENAQRADLNPIEVAEAFQRLIAEFRMTQEEVAEKVGQSRSHVANTLRLLELPPEIRQLVSRGTITAGAGRALLAVRHPGERARLAKEVAAGNLSVRQLEARGSKPQIRDAKAGPKVDANLAELAEDIQAALAMRVRITGTPRRGALTISYHAPSELARIHRLLKNGSPTASPADRDDDGMLSV
jgi:ParB family chromosome partitioning protein